MEAQRRKEKENHLLVARIKEEMQIHFIHKDEEVKEDFEKKKAVILQVQSQKDNAA